jgi:fucose permease
MGVALSLLGPSVSYLEDRLNVSTGVIGILFALVAIGNFVGALLGGRWITRWTGHQVLHVGIVSFAVGTVLLAISEKFIVACLAVALIGAATGMADTAMNTMVVWARSGRSGPALNALHLMFGVGALFAPLIVDRSLAWTHSLWLAVVVVTALAIIAACIVGRRAAPQHPVHSDDVNRPQLPRRTVLVVSVFFMLYIGGEVGFGGWIFTYAEEIGMAGSLPALVTAAFWGAFCLGRLVAIPVSGRVRPLLVVFTACALSVVALVVMIVGSGDIWTVWFGAAVFGFAAGPQYPTMLAMVDDKLSLSASATSWIIGAAAVGGLIVPTSIGPLIDSQGSDSMPVVVLIVCALSLLWVLVVQRSINRAHALHRRDVIHQH